MAVALGSMSSASSTESFIFFSLFRLLSAREDHAGQMCFSLNRHTPWVTGMPSDGFLHGIIHDGMQILQGAAALTCMG
jgi:hypothetical protein